MIVQTDHGKYRVRFKYLAGAYPEEPSKTTKVIKTTVAEIAPFIPDTGFDEGLIGYSWCSHLDRFNREIGRKVALTRALASLPRELRRKFWEAYHGRANGKV